MACTCCRCMCVTFWITERDGSQVYPFKVFTTRNNEWFARERDEEIFISFAAAVNYVIKKTKDRADVRVRIKVNGDAGSLLKGLYYGL